jgi:parallel beta-helix repeat protein
VQPWQLERLIDCPFSQGIVIRNAANFIIENNTVRFSTDYGIDYAGRNGKILGNKVRNIGTDSSSSYHGIKVVGNDNLVDGNVLQLVMSGIQQASGDGNIYTNNVVDFAINAGIHVASGTDILIGENTISNCQADAIAITGGFEVVVRGNALTDNTNDLCNERGSNADVTLQSAATTTASCIVF